jgi:hypothetical protein
VETRLVDLEFMLAICSSTRASFTGKIHNSQIGALSAVSLWGFIGQQDRLDAMATVSGTLKKDATTKAAYRNNRKFPTIKIVDARK